MRATSLAVALLVLPALAQAGGAAAGTPPSSSRAWGESPAVFLGYSYTHAGEARLNGWQASGSYPFGKALRAVVELDGHYGSFAQADLNQATFMAGVRWAFPGDRLAPFADVLLGGVRTKTSVAQPGGEITDSDTDWGGTLGGGVDYRFADRWAARARLDVVVLRAEGSWSGDPRVTLGVVYRLGH